MAVSEILRRPGRRTVRHRRSGLDARRIHPRLLRRTPRRRRVDPVRPGPRRTRRPHPLGRRRNLRRVERLPGRRRPLRPPQKSLPAPAEVGWPGGIATGTTTGSPWTACRHADPGHGLRRVPEPKTAKNHIHWDVTVPAVAPLVAAGVAVLREPGGEIGWYVLADPEETSSTHSPGDDGRRGPRAEPGAPVGPHAAAPDSGSGSCPPAGAAPSHNLELLGDWTGDPVAVTGPVHSNISVANEIPREPRWEPTSPGTRLRQATTNQRLHR